MPSAANAARSRWMIALRGWMGLQDSIYRPAGCNKKIEQSSLSKPVHSSRPKTKKTPNKCAKCHTKPSAVPLRPPNMTQDKPARVVKRSQISTRIRNGQQTESQALRKREIKRCKNKTSDKLHSCYFDMLVAWSHHSRRVMHRVIHKSVVL